MALIVSEILAMIFFPILLQSTQLLKTLSCVRMPTYVLLRIFQKPMDLSPHPHSMLGLANPSEPLIPSTRPIESTWNRFPCPGNSSPNKVDLLGMTYRRALIEIDDPRPLKHPSKLKKDDSLPVSAVVAGPYKLFKLELPWSRAITSNSRANRSGEQQNPIDCLPHGNTLDEEIFGAPSL